MGRHFLLGVMEDLAHEDTVIEKVYHITDYPQSSAEKKVVCPSHCHAPGAEVITHS